MEVGCARRRCEEKRILIRRRRAGHPKFFCHVSWHFAMEIIRAAELREAMYSMSWTCTVGETKSPEQREAIRCGVGGLHPSRGVGLLHCYFLE